MPSNNPKIRSWFWFLLAGLLLYKNVSRREQPQETNIHFNCVWF